METCYEYLGCRNDICVMFGSDGTKRCWEVGGTLCNHEGIELMKNMLGNEIGKETVCVKIGCLYYKMAHKAGVFSGTNI